MVTLTLVTVAPGGMTLATSNITRPRLASPLLVLPAIMPVPAPQLLFARWLGKPIQGIPLIELSRKQLRMPLVQLIQLRLRKRALVHKPLVIRFT